MPGVTDPEKEKRTETIWQRVDAVAQLILENDLYLQKNRTDELNKVVAEKYQVSKRTAQRYIQEARREINKLGKTNKKKSLSKAVRDREYLLQIAKVGLKDKNKNYIVKPNHKLALEILKDREELFGLYIQKIEQKTTVNLKGFDLGKLSEEELVIVEGMVKRGEDPRSYLISKGLFIGNT